MAFDDDDNPSLAPASAPGTEEAAAAADDEIEDGVPDYLAFARSLKGKGNGKGKGGLKSNAIRRGEKDFESHGTKAQENTLEESRRVMEEILSYERVHPSDKWLRGWYFPDWWVGENPGLDAVEANVSRTAPIFRQHRCVVMEKQSSATGGSVGRQIPGVKEREPGSQGVWLLPEEALFLVERGSVDLWWPDKELPELLPGLGKQDNGTSHEDPMNVDESLAIRADKQSVVEKSADQRPLNNDSRAEYEKGLPLSLEAAYALLIGYEGERGKITLPKYQIYANLKRAGFHVLRAPPRSQDTALATEQPSGQPLWQWLLSLLQPRKSYSHVPMLRPGVYRSYNRIYPQLELIQRHQPSSELPPAEDYDGPFQVCFHVWKSDGRKFSKKAPPRPADFRVAVVESRETSVPTAREAAALFGATPLDPPDPAWAGNSAGQIYKRLQHGHHNVVLAVVDRGISSYIRLGDGAFGEEKLWERFDTQLTAKPRNQGKGSNSNRGGRGGRRGRGRGR